MDIAAASRQVKALEADGFVEKYATAADGRVVVLHLTRAGNAVYRRIVTLREAYMSEVLSHWSTADRSALTTLVERLVDDLKKVRFASNASAKTA